MARERDAVEDALRFAELAVAYCDPQCQEATAMLVTELAENMIKYGAPGTTAFAGTLSITVEKGMLRVRATNEVARAEDAERVERTIALISTCANVASLYRARLGELFANPDLPRAELGLLRAAFEGGARLSCVYEPPLLHIIAERPCGAT